MMDFFKQAKLKVEEDRMNILLLGAPGSGKGSQAKILESQYCLKHISTGDILRESVKNETSLGKLAKEYMNKGELVPDELILDLIEERMSKDDCVNGVIFDGFPRTLKQAEGLDNLLIKNSKRLNCVLSIDVPFDKIITRLTARMVCNGCGKDYNKITNPPKSNKCDVCNGDVIVRADDNETTIKNRLDVYKRSTEPLIEYYKNKNILKRIDGDKDVNLVFENIKSLLV